MNEWQSLLLNLHVCICVMHGYFVNALTLLELHYFVSSNLGKECMLWCSWKFESRRQMKETNMFAFSCLSIQWMFPIQKYIYSFKLRCILVNRSWRRCCQVRRLLSQSINFEERHQLLSNIYIESVCRGKIL